MPGTRKTVMIKGISYHILEEFPVYKCSEVDHTGWIVQAGDKRRCVLTKYAKPYFADVNEAIQIVKSYRAEADALANLILQHLI